MPTGCSSCGQKGITNTLLGRLEWKQQHLKMSKLDRPGKSDLVGKKENAPVTSNKESHPDEGKVQH